MKHGNGDGMSDVGSGPSGLSNDQADRLNKRGIDWVVQRRFSEAIDDFGRAIEIYEQLVSAEGRSELGHDLAECYHNRAIAFRNQGRFSEAVADYSKTIALQEQLMERESRPELRSHLAQCLYDRGLSRTVLEEWEEAGADIDRGGILLREQIEQGRRNILALFVWMGGFRCAHAEELGNAEKATQWANAAMQWFCEEVRAGRSKKLLLKTAERFIVHLEGNLNVLLENGLDTELWETFRRMLKEALGKVSR